MATKLGRSRSRLYPYARSSSHARARLHDHPSRRHRRSRHDPDRAAPAGTVADLVRRRNRPDGKARADEAARRCGGRRGCVELRRFPQPRREGEAGRATAARAPQRDASAPVASLSRRARPKCHGRCRRADAGAGGHGEKPRVPLHPARCRHLSDPALRPRRQRGAAGARALGPADRRGAEPAPGRPRPRSGDRRLAPERRRFARRVREAGGGGSSPAASEAGSASTARRRRSGSRPRPADACACASPMRAMRGPCACASTG